MPDPGPLAADVQRQHAQFAGRSLLLDFSSALGLEAAEVGLARVVDEGHGGGDGSVACDLGDRSVHPLTDSTVSLVALRARSEARACASLHGR